MLYSDGDITQALRRGTIAIEGLADGAIQPASVDMHLSGESFRVWDLQDQYHDHEVIKPWEDQTDNMVTRDFLSRGDRKVIVLAAGEFALASISERVKIGPEVAGRIEGKSSLGRLGLLVHVTAGFFDPGFEGYPTLELVNLASRPMMLVSGMAIAQMSFFEMVSQARHPYGTDSRSKYQGQSKAPAVSQGHRNFEMPPGQSSSWRLG